MERFDIILVDFPDGPRHGATPADAVAKAFGISVEVAAPLVATLPSVVRRDASREEAKKYYNALTYVGGTVRFEASRRAPSPEAPAATPPPEAVSPASAPAPKTAAANRREPLLSRCRAPEPGGTGCDPIRRDGRAGAQTPL